MRAIIRVAAQYGPAVASAMASAAGVARSAEEIFQHAVGIARQWQAAHAGVEHGDQPSNPHPQMAYFRWEWDARFGCWRVAQWSGSWWVIL